MQKNAKKCICTFSPPLPQSVRQGNSENARRFWWSSSATKVHRGPHASNEMAPSLLTLTHIDKNATGSFGPFGVLSGLRSPSGSCCSQGRGVRYSLPLMRGQPSSVSHYSSSLSLRMSLNSDDDNHRALLEGPAGAQRWGQKNVGGAWVGTAWVRAAQGTLVLGASGTDCTLGKYRDRIWTHVHSGGVRPYSTRRLAAVM